MTTVVPPASGPELGRTALTDAGAGAAAISDAGVLHVPVTFPMPPLMVKFRSLVVPVETDGTGDPVPLVKLTADPGALIGGWLATITVEGMVNVTGWVAGVAPLAVTDAFTVPERVSPLMALERLPKVKSSAKLLRLNLAPAAGDVGFKDPVTTRPLMAWLTGLPATIRTQVAVNGAVSAPAGVLETPVAATRPTVPARLAPTRAKVPPSDAARTENVRFDLIYVSPRTELGRPE
jgi:hypothetical protein